MSEAAEQARVAGMTDATSHFCERRDAMTAPLPTAHVPRFLALCLLAAACDSSSSSPTGDASVAQDASTAQDGSTPEGDGSTEQDGGATEDASIPDEPEVPPTLDITELGRFDEPWAMTELPDGALLITEKSGVLKLRESDGEVSEISGVPDVVYAGQGGLGDVILHPDFADNDLVYLSWVEAGDGGRSGAAVGRARFNRDERSLADLDVVWRQSDKVDGNGHYGHRLAFDGDGYLWITSGERQKFDPAQDMESNLGKLVRLNDDGTAPTDNPFFEMGGVTAEIWSLGHRNPLGIAFAPDGTLWMHEMGPEGGDELNRIERGANYGWPVVSEGVHYGGEPIPKHDTRPDIAPPEVFWTPVIAPAGFIIYSGKLVPGWRGDGFIGGLQSQGLVRVTLGASGVREAERIDMGQRIREVEEASDGTILVLEDGGNARLLRITPQT
jgi:glucose/arabinose dehydrogenase